jgi:hypothetical protein
MRRACGVANAGTIAVGGRWRAELAGVESEGVRDGRGGRDDALVEPSVEVGTLLGVDRACSHHKRDRDK